MPLKMNMSKGDAKGQRQLDFLRRFRAAACF